MQNQKAFYGQTLNLIGPATYTDMLRHVMIPYKNRMLQLHGLPADQWMILKHDLHYSHTDVGVLQFMKDNRIASLFVPAKCTDELQECDVIINKPYKDGVRQAFRDHIDDIFQKHRNLFCRERILFFDQISINAK